MLPGLFALPVLGLAETTLEKIERTGVFSLGVREATPPYGWLNEQNQYVGFSTDIARMVIQKIEELLGISIQIDYIPVTGRTRIPLLLNGTIDLEAGATVITEEREDVVDFSFPFFCTSTCLLVARGSMIASVEDLAGKRVGGHRGGIEEIIISNLNETGRISPPATFIGYEEHSSGFTALASGLIDAYMSDAPILYGLRRSAPNPDDWKVVDPGVNVTLQAFPLRENDSDFRDIVNMVIAELYRSGQWLTLYEEYFVPEGFPPEPPPTLQVLIKMFALP